MLRIVMSLSRHLFFSCYLVGLVLLASLSASFAQTSTTNSTALIAQAENWLNGLTTMSARFTQVTDDGVTSHGDFYLQRPFNTRFNYDAPDDLVLITTRFWLHVEEISRQQVTSYPVGQTLLKHVLSPQVRLDAAGIITSARRQDGVVLISLQKETGGDAGMLQLAFAEEPFALLGWTIRDVVGTTTQVAFAEVARGVTLSPRLFIPTEYKNDDQR